MFLKSKFIEQFGEKRFKEMMKSLKSKGIVPQELGPWQKAWLRTLKSGLFNQTTGVLCRFRKQEYSFCCLGIACEVAIENGKNIELGEHRGVFNYNNVEQVLPEEVRDLFLFEETGGSFNDTFSDDVLDELERFGSFEKEVHWIYWETKYESLAELNDIAKYSFEQIAEFVELFPQYIFVATAQYNCVTLISIS